MKTVHLYNAYTLSELRRLRGFNQTKIAAALDTTQSAVSRLERQEDMLLSTLAGFVSATGGQLRLIASYEDSNINLIVYPHG